jgi:maltose/moltooligosaccharide transporter
MQKPRLSFWQIWNMSFGFFGIQFGWGLQMANMSAIYRYLGAEESDIAFLWLAAPLTGLIVQPIIGYASDRTWGRLGRRRPYFLIGALLASFALLGMPNCSAVWMAAGLLWILDASINVSMEPFRAFVGDLLPREQRKTGFAMQSLLIGLGAVLSSALPFMLTNGFGVSQEATVKNPIPPSVVLAFYIGSAVFFAAVLYTIITTKEHPPEDLVAFERMKAAASGPAHVFQEIFGGIGKMPKTMRQLAIVQFFTWLALFCMWIYFPNAVGRNVFGGVPLGVAKPIADRLQTDEGKSYIGHAVPIAKAYETLKKQLAEEASLQAPPVSIGTTVMRMFGLKAPPSDSGERIDRAALTELIAKHWNEHTEFTSKEAQNPLVQTFASALLTSHVNPASNQTVTEACEQIQRDLATARAYQQGVAWGGVCFAIYNGTAFVFAFLLLALVRAFSARAIHRVCLLCGGLGLILAFGMHQKNVLPFCMVLVGFAWASILSMPYAMLSNAIPAAKMGFYMGVFNFFIVIPQILASLGLGALMKSFLGDNPMNAVLLGGCSMIAAAICVSFVSKDVDTVADAEPKGATPVDVAEVA